MDQPFLRGIQTSLLRLGHGDQSHEKNGGAELRLVFEFVVGICEARDGGAFGGIVVTEFRKIDRG
jgi:hypothetical protein